MVLVKPETDEEEDELPVQTNSVKTETEFREVSLFYIGRRNIKNVYHCHRNCIHNSRESILCTCKFHLSAPEIPTLHQEVSGTLLCTDECLSWREHHQQHCRIRQRVHDSLACLCVQNISLDFEAFSPTLFGRSLGRRTEKKLEVLKESNLPSIAILDTSEDEGDSCKSPNLSRKSLKRRNIVADIQLQNREIGVSPPKRAKVKRRNPKVLSQVTLRKRPNRENQENQSVIKSDQYHAKFDDIEVIKTVPGKRKRAKREVLQVFDNTRSDDMSISDYKTQLDYKRQLRTDAIAEVAGGYVKTSTSDDMPSTNPPNHFLHTNSSSMATLSNIGNSCYLNSVIYTLRFAPLFLHNLHHLVSDLNQLNQRLGYRYKSSSLGRNIGGLQGASGRSLSSKDLASLSINSSLSEVSKSNRQVS